MRQLQPRKSGKRLGLRPASGPSLGFETLEARQLFSTLNGFSLVDQLSFPGTATTVTNQPTIFEDELTKSWQALVSGQMKIQGQTIQQEIASAVQQAEHNQGLSAYNIGTSLNANGIYSASLTHTSSGANLELSYDVKGNSTTFTSTTNSILGSYADPTFHVTYELDLNINLSLPSNLATGKVTASASATTSHVSVSTNNLLVGLANVFGNNIPQKIANGINGNQQDLSSIVPTGLLGSALQLEAANGYTHLHIGLDSGGNLLLTAQKPTLTVNGAPNDNISISSGLGGSVIVTAAGKTQTFDAGYLKTIVVDTGTGHNTVNVPSLPAGIAVRVVGVTGIDNVVVGGSGSLASVAGTVTASNSSGQTTLTVNDFNDPAASNLKVTSNAVQFQGRSVVTYSSGSGIYGLTVKSGAHGSNITVLGTATGVPTTIQTDTGTDKIAIDGSSSAITLASTSGTDAVTIGNGSLASIGGPVSVSNSSGKTTVDINDSADTVSRTVELTSSAVTFQGLTTIQLGTHVSSVEISDGIAGNTYDAQSSPSADFFTIFGHLDDTVTGPAANQVGFIPIFLFPFPTKF